MKKSTGKLSILGYPLVAIREEDTDTPPEQRITPMTICIAAIAANTEIYCACDRMITSGDVEFEPDIPFMGNTKILRLTTGIIALTAGSSSLHAKIHQEAFESIGAQIKSAPNSWIKVREVANLWVDIYNKIRNQNIENGILKPLGLDHKTFILQQKNLDRDFIEKIHQQIGVYEMPIISAIITGVDDIGPHIYVVENGSSNGSEILLRCYDAIGFAAIGSGARHAETVFMSSGHHRFASSGMTSFLCYRAKKLSEIAPGVGQGTDMFAMGPGLGVSEYIPREIVEHFSVILKQRTESEKIISKNEQTMAEEFLKQLIELANQQAHAKIQSIPPEPIKPAHPTTEPQPPSAQSPDAGPSTTPPPAQGRPSSPQADPT
ncbi:MAG TPA: hypothetical protein VK737_01590 [Opitutales bacterium]|jgi:hypothetical protein|nr:hypothetical protein [Opitutales bacterium]